MIDEDFGVGEAQDVREDLRLAIIAEENQP